MKRVIPGVLLFISAALAQAQHEGGVKNVQRLNRAPVSQEVLQVRLPRPKEYKLPNGLTVLILEQHKLPAISFSLWIKTGALSDPKELPGLAAATAEMLREGTESKDSAQLSEDIDAIGASLGASASFGSDVTKVSASALTDYADPLLTLMADVVLRPAFRADELEKYRKRLLARLDEQRSTPHFLAQERFMRALYGDFPAAVISATPASAKALTSEKLQEFHDRHYAPGNAILGVVGDVKSEEILKLVKKRFGDWKPRKVSAPALGAVPPPAAAKIYLIDRPGSVQTVIMAGDLAVRRVDPDYIPLKVANRVLGGGPSSRLFLNLREEKGYTYGAYSWFAADVYPGPWTASTEVRNAVTDGSLHELMAEFRRIREEKIPEDELGDSRRAMVASFALSLEQPSTLLDYALTAKYFRLPEDYWDRYPEKVSAVSPDAAQAMAKKYVDLDHLQIVCVGDAKQIADALKKYGTVEVYDAEGKRKE